MEVFTQRGLIESAMVQSQNGVQCSCKKEEADLYIHAWSGCQHALSDEKRQNTI